MKIPSDDIVYELIPKYLSGQTSEQEIAVIEHWKLEDPEHARSFEELSKIWKLTEMKSSETLAIDLDKEWNLQKDLLQTKVQTDSTPVVSMNVGRSTNFWFRIAAAVIFLILSGAAFIYLTQGWSGLGILDNTYYAESVGEEVSFKDGTLITLNSNSQIKASKSYNKADRVVDFEGEAFFEVTPNPDKPFIIRTGGAEIRVVGTSFNVRAFPDESYVEVTVVSGEVVLSNASRSEAVALKANDTGILKKDSGVLARNENTNINYLSWKTRNIEFDNTSIHEVLETLNRVYGEKNLIINPNLGDTCSITVKFENQSLEAVLKVLKSTLDLTYEIQGDTIIIIDAGC